MGRAFSRSDKRKMILIIFLLQKWRKLLHARESAQAHKQWTHQSPSHGKHTHRPFMRNSTNCDSELNLPRTTTNSIRANLIFNYIRTEHFDCNGDARRARERILHLFCAQIFAQTLCNYTNRAVLWQAMSHTPHTPVHHDDDKTANTLHLIAASVWN